MNLEQREQRILTLIDQLPLIHRIKLALTVLRGIDPKVMEEEIDSQSSSWETITFFQELDNRYHDMITGDDPGMDIDELMTTINTRLS